MLNAYTLSGLGWLDASSVYGRARGILNMGPSTALPGCPGQTAPLAAGLSSPFLSAKSRDGCGMVRDGGSCDLPPLLHHLPPSGKYSAHRLLQRLYQASPDFAPGKEVVKELGVSDTSFHIKELITVTPHCVSMKSWSKNQGHSQGSKTLCVTLPSCHFSFCSGGSL